MILALLCSCGPKSKEVQCGVSSLTALFCENGRLATNDEVSKTMSTDPGSVSFDQLRSSGIHFGIELKGFRFTNLIVVSKISGAIEEQEINILSQFFANDQGLYPPAALPLRLPPIRPSNKPSGRSSPSL